MSRWVAAAVLAAGCRAQQPGTSASTPAAWEGAHWPPAPGGVAIERGTTLGTADTAGFALAEVTVGRERLLWLGRRSGERSGAATWTVTDALVLPPLGADRQLILALCGSPASAGGVTIDPEIVAVARAGDAAVLREIEAAWRANRSTGRFQEVPTAGIACLNEVES
ncbi:MAG TPA: hypothetical protein VE913_07320 [Longimicrobium sp.]|nr:hypothetical protein [Longimicrobium sp.]